VVKKVLGMGEALGSTLAPKIIKKMKMELMIFGTTEKDENDTFRKIFSCVIVKSQETMDQDGIMVPTIPHLKLLFFPCVSPCISSPNSFSRLITTLRSRFMYL
jgi:hypothetical protein